MDSLEDIIDSAVVPNDTFIFMGNETEDDAILYKLHTTCVFLVEWLAMIADGLIVSAILNNSRMRTRRNIILLNWAIFDMLFLSNILGLVVEVILVFQDKSVFTPYEYCLIVHSNVVFKFSSSLMILLLMSTVIMRTAVVRDEVVIALGYSMSLIIFIANFVICLNTYPEIIYMLYFVLMITQFLVLIAKEINICRKARREDPISEKTRIIINIARIYIYNQLILLAYFSVEYDFTYFLGIILSFWELSMPATSIYILIYLLRSDENFRNCVINMCCKCGRSSEVDATVTYTDNATLDQVNVDFARIQDDR